MTAPEIKQEIEQTRERLGQTVEELAARADVKARARAKAGEVSRRVKQSVQRRWPLAAAVGVAAVGSLVAGSVMVWRWRKT